ncbi:sodium-dependent proline transporter [Erpetoichthys calabaricus]|uniref:sodium-dependent proline transporter n=1 Tax=Erpetoichthys calabaricus TaxID=27687 RepID=UPI002234716D|nr:sodium-dependent proline transporter [Erpetoichthys calabaricus]XP_051782441.1 sodium-dependent proline transporter [Erpetoichthys calabaricus]XP_051782442.1 sodium-dependent proline transporter [Erpetoichthys calabaricus]XP_051782443.1 sodium-dependent proline transporter [Erpetoichthys calabaricus]
MTNTPGPNFNGVATTTAQPESQNPVQLNGVVLQYNEFNPSAQHQSPVQHPNNSCTPSPPASTPAREKWAGQYEFLLSCIGYCVGLGNVWRFPYLCYRNGGGVFLIPYTIMLLFTGLPLFLMELSLGQYGSAGPIMVWKCCPLLKGIGIGMLLVSTFVCLYYNVIIAWTFYYLGMSFQNPLPWSCQAIANAGLCKPNGTNASLLSASEIFWNTRVLGVVNSKGLSDPGPVKWELAICLLVAWIVIYLCMLKGIRSSGKVVYVTATFPYFVLFVLIIRGATLQGSLKGVQFYLTPDWKRLLSAQVWNDAASQIFYSLGIGFGGLLSMASYNKFDNNVIRDTLVIAIGNCCTSFFAGFAIFSILGHMAWKKNVPVGKVADTGPGLAFVAYPEALALLPGSVFWSILFFLMLFMLGVDTLFGNMEAITTAVLDEFPVLRGNFKKKCLFLALLCFGFYLMGLLLITDGGIYWFTLIDFYSTSFGLIIIALFMCIGMTFFYGVNQFCQDIVDMVCRCPPWCTKLLMYFKACWVFFTPVLLLFILSYIFVDLYNTPLRYGSYIYPRWGRALGVCMGTFCCIQIPFWGIMAIWRESGTLKDRFQKAIQPLNSWRAASRQNDAPPEMVDVPYSVNLADADFTSQEWESNTSEA